jgi:hypothetical protein
MQCLNSVQYQSRTEHYSFSVGVWIFTMYDTTDPCKSETTCLELHYFK